jgi:hypothetical protein
MVKAVEELAPAKTEGLVGVVPADDTLLGAGELKGLLFQNARLGIVHLPPL